MQSFKSKFYILIYMGFTFYSYLALAKIDDKYALYKDQDFTHYELKQNSDCMTKKEIIEKQTLFNFENYQKRIEKNYLTEIELEKTLTELREIAELWSCHFKSHHLEKDSIKQNPTMPEILNFVEKVAKQGGEYYPIQGSQKYYKLFKKKYYYDLVITPEQKVIIRLKINFDLSALVSEDKKNESKRLLDQNSKGEKIITFMETFQRNLAGALKLWNKALPENFSLEIVRSDKKDAHYNVKIKTNVVSALYDKFWFFALSEEDYAHEISHMLGLNEEYGFFNVFIKDYFYSTNALSKRLASQISDATYQRQFLIDAQKMKANQCFLYSINCTSSNLFLPGYYDRVIPMIAPYQLHHILRRLPVNS